MKKIDEKGRTMLEVILVLSIFSVLSVSIVMMVTKVMDKYRLSKIGTQLYSLQKNISALYMSEGNYTNIKDSILIAKGAIPSNMISGTKVSHAFGGDVDIKGQKNSYTVTFHSIGKAPCIELGLLNWKINETNTLDVFTVNNTSFKKEPTTLIPKSLPPSVTDMGSLCKDSRGNVLTWVFL